MVQGKYYMLTIPQEDFTPYLPPTCAWIKGQLELGAGGFLHWQVVVAFERKVRPGTVREIFGNCHHELCRSSAADSYVHKEETRIEGTQFEFGNKLLKRSSEKDWESVWNAAKSGNMLDIPADIRIRCYHTLKRIRKDHDSAPMRQNLTVKVFWGVTGSGKSHRMHQEAYDDDIPYVKSSTTKWWDGYRGEKRVIMDEFRGKIAIEHMLKWLDKYPCYVEEKGGQLALQATEFWICSNVSPREWYPEIDEMTLQALLRRLTITRFLNPFNIILG